MSPDPRLKTDVAHPARVYDYLLGGKDNFKADRDLGDQVLQALPSIRTSARANRAFMARAARFLASKHGIRQFLDIGTGLPTSPNLHEVVQQVNPASRVVYVDNDPMVLTHARALLTSSPEGRTAYLDADLSAPEAIMSAPELQILDLSEPVVVSMMAIVHFVHDEDLVHRVLATLMEPLPAGSFLALSAVTNDNAGDSGSEALGRSQAGGMPIKNRSHDEVQDLFRGLELLEPGVVLVHRWHPDEQAAALADDEVHLYGGVAVKR